MEHKKGLRDLFKLILLWIGIQSTSCVEFDRELTGVAYSAFVYRSENGEPIPAWETYTLKNIKTMLEVISTKFTRIATYGVGAKNVVYEKNSTYYEGTQGFTAEAAALINQERMNLTTTVIVGMWLSDEDVQMDTEIDVAFETAEIANNIYNGTVVGLVASHSEIGNKDKLERTKQALDVISKIKDRAHAVGLKVGTRQSCYEKKRESGELLKQIVNMSDFIICDMQPAQDQRISGGKAGFETVGNDLLVNQHLLKRINPDIEVMGQTGWPSKGKEPWQTIDNLRMYWETANEWAVKNNFTMWLFEAFDNPWKNWDAHSAHYGWWKLRRNMDINEHDGYAEKIYEPPEEEPTVGTSPWIIVGVALGVGFMVLIMAMFTLLFMRVQQLQKAITPEDIREFMEGISADAAQGGQMENALMVPYDKSYEISKDKLQIKRDAILGTGQFGCVYKALIEDDNKTEVALKMAKHDCPKNALKSLLSEIKILTYLGKHPNIVCILGAYTSELSSGIVYVATELCPLGSLEDYLRSNQISNSNTSNADRYSNAPALILNEAETNVDRPSITYRDMVQWSHEIACGMEYLGTKHVVHADLSTRNVLLASDKTAKITDFGLSRRLYDYTNYVKQQQEPLPWRWMAIESLKRLEFSSKSDVWSYGVTLWEIFAMGDLPYPGLSWNLDFVDSLVNGLRMKSPPHATPEVYDIMVDCWHLEPNERPTFTDLKLSTGHLFDAGTGEVNNPTKNTYANFVTEPEPQPQPPSTVYTEVEL